MNQTAFDEQDEKPLDPAMERVRRKMLRLLIISIGIMFTGLMAVLIAIVYKFTSAPSKATNPAVAATALKVPGDENMLTGDIALPAGTRIISQSVNGSRLSMMTEAAGGEQEIVIYDMNAGRVIARFAIRAGNH